MHLPHPTNVLHTEQLPPLPASWSELTWQQLCAVWTAKMQYGGNPDVAVCAAMLALCQLTADGTVSTDPATGETVYQLKGKDGQLWTVAPRQLSHLAHKALPWFAYPYGDAGDREERDDQGKVVKERREGHQGYVNPGWRDAMVLPEREIVVCVRHIVPLSRWEQMSEEDRQQPVIDEWNAMSREQRQEVIVRVAKDKDEKEIRQLARRDWQHTDEQLRQQILHSSLFTFHFALPELACNNLTWHQYRTLQGLTPQLFQEGTSDEQTLELQAQFLAAMLVPEQTGSRGHDRFEKQHPFKYDADRAEQSQQFWLDMLRTPQADGDALPAQADVLFHICFQVYQTAMRYYEIVFPLLFSGNGKDDPLRDALTGEVGTINAVMKYAGYGDQQQVYDANLPFILDILNTMTKEAKEIEKMNQQIKSKRK